MKINDLGKKSPVKKSGDSGSATSAKSVGKAGNNQSPVSAGNKAGVSVSGTDQISASLGADGSARAARVASVKLDVDNGTYQADSQKTAEKIVNHLTDYSLA
jgi:anti-sigma28 factor (negative regulator of flagellin synthesis)